MRATHRVCTVAVSIAARIEFRTWSKCEGTTREIRVFLLTRFHHHELEFPIDAIRRAHCAMIFNFHNSHFFSETF